MKKQYHNPRFLRTLANEKAAKANKHFKKAREADKMYHWYNHKVRIVRDFLLNSPWALFTLIYFALLIIDAFIMKPIIAVVVQHGFKFTGDLMLLLFVVIYVVLVAALTIGVAYGFAKVFDQKLRGLQVELDTISSPGIARSVIEEEIRTDEQRDRMLGVVFAIILFALLITLSLYRNYIMNGFEVKFNSPDDWVNLLIPIALALALCFFGIYKDVVYRLYRLKSDMAKYESLRDGNQDRADELAKQAVEQEHEAKNNHEDIQPSADLKMLLERYEGQSIVNDTFYDEVRVVKIRLTNKNKPVEGIQVLGITGDDVTIYKTTDAAGIAIMEWTTEADFIRTLKIGSFELRGNRWQDGSTVDVELEDFVMANVAKSNGNGYLHQRISLPDNNGFSESTNTTAK
jgi:hypothetical protein